MINKGKEEDIISEILPGELYLGNMLSHNEEIFKKFGIKTVINVCGVHHKKRFRGVEYKFFLLIDFWTEKICKYFQRSFDAIHDSLEKKKPVLVHCRQGISRSATLVISYLMKAKGLSDKEALEYVKKRRSIVEPNHGFIKQLNDYHKELTDKKEEEEEEAQKKEDL